MGAYNPKRRPDSYPMAYHRAFERAIGGQMGMRYETCLGEASADGQGWYSQYVASFKASVKRYPLHPLHDLIPRTRTRLRAEPLGGGRVRIWLGVTLYSAPSSALDGLLE